jgi:hypothetical protein
MSNANQETRQANRLRVGGLWTKTSQFGGEFYTGKLNLKELVAKFGPNAENVSIVIFQAKEQKTPNSPTHNLFADLPQAPAPQPPAKPAPAVAKTKPAASSSGAKPRPNTDFGPESEFGDPSF